MSTWSLREKIALVTGAGRRVGRAIALELGAAGCHVIVHHHTSASGARETAAQLAALGAPATVVQADLTDPDATAAMFDAIDRGPGGPDVAVLSAAIFERAPFLSMTDAQLRRMIDVNLVAPARVARLAARRMEQRGAGVLVSILDVAALQPWRGFAHYCAAKAGLEMMTRCLALELAPAVRVNGIAPGTVVFRDDEDEATRARVLRNIPLGRIGEPGDVARAVRFLCEGSDFLTGVILPVDGGRSQGAGAGP